MTRWAEGLGGLLDFLLPTGCVVCRAWIARDIDKGDTVIVCARCRTRLEVASWPRCPRCHAPRGTGRGQAPDCLECREWPAELSLARYAHVLTSPASDLVHGLKYEGWAELACLMGRRMARVVERETPRRGRLGRIEGVVPVPTTERRRSARGYNQAALLAKVVSETLRLPLLNALERSSAPASQTTLSPDARRENVRGAFGVISDQATRIRGMDVLLVDDVLTTGATAGEAARSLVSVGARSVRLLTFARALPQASSLRRRPAA